MRIKVDKYPENSDWPKRVREERARAMLLKHYGPGNHPGTGNPQSIHGSGRIRTARGYGVLDGEPISKYLVTAEGEEIVNSFEALEDVHYVTSENPNEIIKSDSGSDIKERILEAARAAGLNPDDIDRNFTTLMESALARYNHPEDVYEGKKLVAGPSLVDADRFYEAWHSALQQVSDDTGLGFSEVIAAAAVISPSQSAPANLHFAQDLATWVADDVEWSGESRDEILDALVTARDGILRPVYMDRHTAVVSGEAQVGDPRPPPKEGSHRWTQGKTLEADIERISDMESFRVSDLSPLTAAYALHKHRGMVGGTDLPSDVPAIFRGKKPKGGFSVKNFSFFADAVAVLRGDVSADVVLGDVKTRSFHNNILDPFDEFEMFDVTVDYHAADSAFMARGFISSNLISSPALEGVGLGVRPLVADAIRRVAETYTVAGESLSAARAQEILWAEWNRGQTEIRELPEGTSIPEWVTSGASTRTITHFQSFDGTLYPLYNVG